MDKWIPVDDSLPTPWTEVLISVCAPLSRSEVCYGYYSDKWVVTSVEGNHANFVTHWMPLPDPPNMV
jgi:hypothetical protein